MLCQKQCDQFHHLNALLRIHIPAVHNNHVTAICSLNFKATTKKDGSSKCSNFSSQSSIFFARSVEAKESPPGPMWIAHRHHKCKHHWWSKIEVFTPKRRATFLPRKTNGSGMSREEEHWPMLGLDCLAKSALFKVSFKVSNLKIFSISWRD